MSVRRVIEFVQAGGTYCGSYGHLDALAEYGFLVHWFKFRSWRECKARH